MAGSDHPQPDPSSGASPTTPRAARRRKRAAAAAAAASPARRTTRSSGGLELEEASRWLRRLAAGQWARARPEGVDAEDERRLRREILEVRRARFVNAGEIGDAEEYPYSSRKKQKYVKNQGADLRRSQRIARNMKHLSSYYLMALRKRIKVDAVHFQADVPQWTNDQSEESIAAYNNDPKTLQRVGTVVRPLHKDISARNEVEVGKGRLDACNCSSPGSVACVRRHVQQARKQLKKQLGEEAFTNCGLDAMGEEVLRSWTDEEKKRFDDLEQLKPDSEHNYFLKIASKKFSSRSQRDLANYYYNVYLPRRMAILTRAESTNATELDTDEEDDDEEDDDDSNDCNDEPNTGEKSTNSASSKRSRTRSAK